MAGNSQRRGAIRKSKPKPVVGSGGRRRAGLKGKGRTLPAEERPWHKAYAGPGPVPERTARKQERAAQQKAAGRRRPPASKDTPELLVGRNPVVEALRAHVPATALYVAKGLDLDERVNESLRTAGDRGIAILEVSRGELDRLTGGAVHQGLGLQVPPYAYLPFEDLLAAAVKPTASPASRRSDAVKPAASRRSDAVKPAASRRSDTIEDADYPLLVALDGVTDPRNLGAVIRSAAAFGGHGVFLPERRAAGITATAWRTSAGAAARLPVARVTNLTRALKACQEAGFMVVGLDADAETGLYDLELAVGPVVLVVGSEGRGLSRLVGATCDLRVAIPMAAGSESLNASVAAAVAMSEVARRRSARRRALAAGS